MKSSLFPVLLSTALLSLAAPVLAAPAVTLAEAGFSAGPGTDYDISKKLAVGSHVDVIWCGTHDNWCLVDFHNKRGWLPMAALSFKVPHAVSTDDEGTPGGATTEVVGPRHAGVQYATRPDNSGGGGSHLTITSIKPVIIKSP
jgi:uncharacterized protein YraI